MRQSETEDSPYAGVDPYSEADARFFFGREAECDLITAHLYASRLTILYGASGVGKTSVLQAGVVAGLHRNPARAVVVFRQWHEDPVAGLIRAIATEVTRARGEPVLPHDDLSLADFVGEYARGIQGPLLVILDQFEEYFLYRDSYSGARSFAAEFARAVNQVDCPVSFLISLREEALAKLDEFEARIPTLFDNYLRLEHLSAEAAEQAIVRPLDVYNQEVPAENQMAIEPGLAKAVVGQVKTGSVLIGAIGRGRPSPRAGGSVNGRDTSRVEAPYLQIVLTRLWHEERMRGSSTLRLATLSALGGAEQIIRTHLDSAMAHLTRGQQEIAAHVFRYLVTPGGTKIALTAGDLAWYTGAADDRIEAVMNRLAQRDRRIVRSTASEDERRSVIRYEIYHDVLAPAVLDWSARFFSRSSISRTLMVAGGGILLAIAVVQWLPGIPPVILSTVRGAGLLVLHTFPLLQVYRWFTRYVGLTVTSFPVVSSGFEPNFGLLLGFLLTLLWYVSTEWPRGAPGATALATLTPLEYVAYWLTVMLTLLYGFLTFMMMRSGGQLTAHLFKRFDAGYYGVYVLACAITLTLTVLTAAGVLPSWIKF